MATINLAIIGLQRLGASLGLAVKRYQKAPGAAHQFTIFGSDESVDNLRTAHKLGAIDQEARTPAAAATKADLIVLAERYGLYDDLYAAIGPGLKPGVVIIDLSPLKQRALKRADEHLPRDEKGALLAYMVGATPILNPALLKDTADSAESARADLFDRGTLVLSPAANCRGEAIQLAADFGELLGMTIHFTEPAEHDGLITAMEGLPLLLNLALFRSLSQSAAWDDLQRLSNPPFALGTLGLEQFGAADAAALFDGNREQAAQALERLSLTIDELRDLLLADDPLLLAEAFEDAITRRDAWLRLRTKNKWDQKTSPVPTENLSLMGVLGTRFSFRGLRPGDADKNGKGGSAGGKK